MEANSRRSSFQFNSQVILLLVVIVAIALGWWQTHDRLRQSEARVDALRRSRLLDVRRRTLRTLRISALQEAVSHQAQTPEQFIKSLHEIEDWYEFADDTADPFAKTPAADDTIPMLISLLDDPDSEIRTRALATLWKINRHPKVVVPAVIPLLDDGHCNVRWHAAYALGRFGEEAQSGIRALRSEMNDDESPNAAFAAMMVRQIDPDIPTEPRLIELLSNPIKQNQERAIRALAELGTPTSIEALVRRYRNENDPKLRTRLALVIADADSKQNAIPVEP